MTAIFQNLALILLWVGAVVLAVIVGFIIFGIVSAPAHVVTTSTTCNGQQTCLGAP